MAWIAWQDISDILTADAPDKLTALADLLLNIGLLLLSRGPVAARVGASLGSEALLDIAEGADLEESIEMSWFEEPEHLLEGGQPSKNAEPSQQLPTSQSASSLLRSDALLERSWSGLYSRLCVIRQAELALYKVAPVSSARRLHSGVHRGLYSAGGDLYTTFEGDWFKVKDQEGVVRLFNEEIEPHEGPQLIPGKLGDWGFAPDLAPPAELPQALAVEQQRLAQLHSEAQRREDLDVEYDKMFAMFDSQVLTDEASLQSIGGRLPEAGRQQVFDDELFKADVTHWCAVTLIDVLDRRRQLMPFREYRVLFGKVCASAVRARRNQVMLYAGQRKLMLSQTQLEVSVFDALRLKSLVLDTSDWLRTAPYLEDFSVLQTKAVTYCQEAEQRLEHMKQDAKVAQLSVLVLEDAAWTGRRASLKWQELQLRTLAIRCFGATSIVYRGAAVDLIQEVTALCSLKLMTRRELFVRERFNWDQRLRVMNDVLDALVLADSRLSYQLAPLPAYLDAKAVGEYRLYVRSVLKTLEKDLVEAYAHYEGADHDAVHGMVNSHPKQLLEDRYDGLVIGNRREVTTDGEQQLYVDVLEPFDHRVVWSFKRHGEGVGEIWQAAVATQTPNVPGLELHDQLAEIGGEANRLWRDAQLQFKQITSLELITRMSPRRVRSEWLNYANKMIKQRDLLIEALKAPAASAAHQALLDFFKNTPSALYDEILRFMEQGNQARHRMILRGYPTNDGLLTLYNTWKINVVEVPVTGALVRQFEIHESSTGRPLWFARFYYENQLAREQAYNFTQGHLKRYVDRDTSYAKLKQRASNRELMLQVLRANIDHEVARTVFFNEAQ